MRVFSPLFVTDRPPHQLSIVMSLNLGFFVIQRKQSVGGAGWAVMFGDGNDGDADDDGDWLAQLKYHVYYVIITA